MPPCAAWLRLLVTALLCVAGVARPVAQRVDATSAVRVHEPMHVAAPTRDAEISRLGRRATDDPAGDTPGLFAHALAHARLESPCDELRVAHSLPPSSPTLDSARARGPPLA